MSERLFYLLGGNGAPNFGDELMALAWFEYLSAAFPGCRIVLDCNSVNTPRGYFGDRFPGLETIEGLKIFCTKVVRERLKQDGKNPKVFLDALAYGLGFFDVGEDARYPELASALDALARAASFHVFGGGYINTAIRPDSGFLIGIAAAIARRYAIPVFATGIGITPLHVEGAEGRALLARALAAFRLFECRDCYGFDKLFEIANGAAPVVNGLDDSFLVRPAAAARPGGGRTLHLCLLRKPLEGAYEALFEELPALAGGFERVVYWDCVPKLFDRNIRKLGSRLPRMEVIDCADLVLKNLPVQPGDFMVTQRFHPHMVATRLGCDGVFLQDGVYYFDKHHSVLHLGSGFQKYIPGALRIPDAPGQAPILARDAAHMAEKARVRDACYPRNGG